MPTKPDLDTRIPLIVREAMGSPVPPAPTTFPTMLGVELLLTTTHDLNTVAGRAAFDKDRSVILDAITYALENELPAKALANTRVFDHACVMSASHFSVRCKALPPLDDSYRDGDAWNKRS
jgi:hypothetical protein